jgi:hypothetical protein
MPKRNRNNGNSNNEQMESDIVKVYQSFSRAELEVIAMEWCGGDYETSHRFPERGCLPIAVTIAALIAVDHPLLCDDIGGVIYSPMGCAIEVLNVILENRKIPQPIFPDGELSTG